MAQILFSHGNRFLSFNETTSGGVGIILKAAGIVEYREYSPIGEVTFDIQPFILADRYNKKLNENICDGTTSKTITDITIGIYYRDRDTGEDVLIQNKKYTYALGAASYTDSYLNPRTLQYYGDNYLIDVIANRTTLSSYRPIDKGENLLKNSDLRQIMEVQDPTKGFIEITDKFNFVFYSRNNKTPIFRISIEKSNLEIDPNTEVTLVLRLTSNDTRSDSELSVDDDKGTTYDYFGDNKDTRQLVFNSKFKDVTKYIDLEMYPYTRGFLNVKMDITLLVGEFEEDDDIPPYEESFEESFEEKDLDNSLLFRVEQIEGNRWVSIPYTSQITRVNILDIIGQKSKYDTKATLYNAVDLCRENKKGEQIFIIKNAICGDKVLRWIDNLGRLNFFAFKFVSQNSSVKNEESFSLDKEATLPTDDSWLYDGSFEIEYQKTATDTMTLAAPNAREYFNTLQTLAKSRFVDLKIADNKWQKVQVMALNTDSSKKDFIVKIQLPKIEIA